MEHIYLTRDQLYETVWSVPVSHLIIKYDLSQHEFRALCKKFDIPLPGIGYWGKIKNNKPVSPRALPHRDADDKPIALRLRDASRPILLKAGPAGDFAVPAKISRPHPLTQETLNRWEDARNKHTYEHSSPHLSIRVDKPNRKRALLFMDAFVKLLEKRGHRIEFKYYRPYAVLYGEDIELDLREASKRIPKPGSYPTFDLVSTGEFVLMTGKYLIAREWRDGKVKIEAMLEKIITWMEAKAEEEAARRERARQKELERKLEQQAREQVIALRDNEMANFTELLNVSEKHDQANKLRTYITAVRAKATAEANMTTELQDYLEWASKKADWLDPLVKAHDHIFDVGS